MTIQEYVFHARLPYEEAVKYVEDNASEISDMYPNALFECILNIKTLNQANLTDRESALLAEDMKYFLKKKSRFTSDSAIVANFLSSYHFKKVDLLTQELENYLFKADTSFGFIYYITYINGSLNTRYEKLEPMFKAVIDKDDSDTKNLLKYLKDFKNFNNIKDDNIIFDRLMAIY